MAEVAPAPVFGRRQTPAAAAAPPELDTAALYSRLTRDGGEPIDASQGFGAWRQARASARRLAWAASLGLMASGAVCVVLNAPAAVSAGLELAGLVEGWWLRRERKRHLAAIRSWDEGAA